MVLFPMAAGVLDSFKQAMPLDTPPKATKFFPLATFHRLRPSRQSLTHLLAVEGVLAERGALPANVKFLVEGKARGRSNRLGPLKAR